MIIMNISLKNIESISQMSSVQLKKFLDKMNLSLTDKADLLSEVMKNILECIDNKVVTSKS